MKPSMRVSVSARGSKLSQAQVWEVERELARFHPAVTFQPLWVETTGDRDLQTSLRTLDTTDFFTKEIDQLLLSGICRVAIHSAKDLPEPLHEGLVCVALTRGLTSVDCLVNDGLVLGARVGCSSKRRDAAVHALRSDLVCCDIRGTIESRLQQLDEGKYDGVVIAECALIRLGLTDRARIPLPGPHLPLQGRLAVLTRKDDEEMRQLFSCIDE